MIKKLGLTPIQILAMGFGFIIFMGGIALCLPISNKDGNWIPFINGLFTATSATCVTGLAVYDTFTQYTFFGQMVIVILIQVGGLGFMAIALVFSFLLGSKLSLHNKNLMAESLGANKYGGITDTIKFMLIGTAMFEGVGTIIIASRFVEDMGFWPALWMGAFHSISAFCNAGFDIMGYYSPGSSIIPFNKDIILEMTIAILIASGGIGFIVWHDIAKHKFNFKKYRLHSKIMVSFTALLIVIGALGFFFIEGSNTFEGMTFGEKLSNSIFASVSPRTAGFSAVESNEMTSAGRILTMLLMLIGAGPGSTAGGVKITTFVVLILAIYANIKNYNDYSIYGRRLTAAVKTRAFSNASAYMLTILLGTFLLTLLNPRINPEALLYEAISALGTVGLSMGITTDLETPSKLILIALMYSGRLGSLAIAMAMVRKKLIPKISFPEENITV